MRSESHSRFADFSKLLVMVLCFGTTCSCQAIAPSASSKLVDELVARGDRILGESTDKKVTRAYWYYVFASKYAPSRKDIVERLKAIVGGPSLGSNQLDRIRKVITSSYSEDLTAFAPATKEMDEVNLRMLLDEALVPYPAFTVGGTAENAFCTVLSDPTMNVDQVRSKYARPSAARRNKDGREILDYGRFRIIAEKEGKVFAVLFSPFPDSADKQSRQ